MRKRVFFSAKYREMPYAAIIIQRPTGAVTYDALAWLKEHNVSLTIMDWDGSILAQILPDEKLNAELRLRQYDAYNSQELRFFILKNLVECKVSRQHDLLKQLAEWYKIQVPTPNRIISTSLDLIRNIEARYANDYFVQFGKVCNELGYDFKVRSSKHGNKKAKDIPNALLNYGYACLETYVRRAISSVGLDNSISFLHYHVKSTDTLTFDLMEIFRPNVDFAVLQTLEELNKKKLSAYYEINQYQVWLKPDAIQRLFQHIKLNLDLFDIINQTRLLAQYIMSESTRLTFNPIPIQVKRKVSPETKKLILTNSARSLGMNKSTHWYQKKQLLQTGNLRIYNTTRHHFTHQELSNRKLLKKHNVKDIDKCNKYKDEKLVRVFKDFEKHVERQKEMARKLKIHLTRYQTNVMYKAIMIWTPLFRNAFSLSRFIVSSLIMNESHSTRLGIREASCTPVMSAASSRCNR